jgi:hypothetical protein
MIETIETNEIRPLTGDELLVVSGGQLPNPGVWVAKDEAALALLEEVVQVVKSVADALWPF